MYDEVMRRPMFQTPQQRQASGIMAGVAPVRGYANGDVVEVEEEGFFDSMASPQGRRDISDSAINYVSDVGQDVVGDVVGFGESQLVDDDERFNVRDVTNMIFDPEDPLDYATMALLYLPPVYMAQKLARKGYSAAQIARQLKKAKKLDEDDYKAETAERMKRLQLGGGPSARAPKATDAPDLPTPPTLPPGILGRAGGKTLGTAVGVGALGAGAYNYLSDSEATPETPEEVPQVNQADQRGGGGNNEVEREPNLLERISGGIGSLAGGTSERDLIRAGAGLGEGRSGRRRINPALDRFKASQVYDDAQKGTALQENFKFFEKMFPEKDAEELMQLAAGKDPEQTVALTLFDTIISETPGADPREAFSLAMELSREFMAGEVTGAGATDPSAEIK